MVARVLPVLVINFAINSALRTDILLPRTISNQASRLAARMKISDTSDASVDASVDSIVAPTAREEDRATIIKRLLERCDPSMRSVWRRADFWVNETATMLEVVNALGRFETCSEWIERTEFAVVENYREENEAQSMTLKRYEMAKRLGCAERVAMWQNLPKLPFRNEALAASVGLTVEDFQSIPVTKGACNILFDGLAESRSGLIPYATMDARRAAMIKPDGSFNEVAFRIGHAKSTILIITGWFIFGKANFIWVLVTVKWLHDIRPDVVPSPVDLGLFKIWGIV